MHFFWGINRTFENDKEREKTKICGGNENGTTMARENMEWNNANEAARMKRAVRMGGRDSGEATLPGTAQN